MKAQAKQTHSQPKRVAQAAIWASVAVLGLLNALSASACEKDGLISQAKGISAFVSNTSAGNNDGKAVRGPVKDRRMTIEDYIANADKITPDPEIRREIIRASKAAVAILEVRDENGKSIFEKSSHSGSGFIAGNECYVVTSRHVVNKMKNISSDSKSPVYESDGEISPNGYRVEVQSSGVGTNGPQKMAGTVVHVLGGPLDPSGDVVVIRLDRRIPGAGTIGLGMIPNAKVPGAPLVTIGHPADWQGAEANRLIIDPSCKGVRQSEGVGMTTDCLVSSGASGSMVLGQMEDKDGKYLDVVSIVRKVPNGTAVSSPSGRTIVYGEAFATSMQDVGQNIVDFIKSDLAQKPCQ